MSSLRELQLGFSEVMWKRGASFDPHVCANGLLSGQRLQVYRNNVVSAQTEALKTTYPVITRLVGEEFFSHLARQYLQARRSQSGNLNDLGLDFDSFLLAFPGTGELVYLPDVAKLEWAVHRLFLETPRLGVSFDSWEQIPDSRYDELRLVIQPASHFLSSVYPVLRIWQVNQTDSEGDVAVNLSAGGVELLIIRRGLEVEFETLTPGEYRLLHALADKHALSTACELALEAQTNFDLVASLQRYIASGVIVDFYFDEIIFGGKS